MEVKIARMKKKLTQKQLRDIVKISPQTLVAIEKGQYQKVSIVLAKKLAKALDVTVNELFFQD